MSRPARKSWDWGAVNSPPEPVLLDISKCCLPATSTGSPIDSFYDTSAHTLTLGAPEALEASPTLGRLLILGLVTGTEAYFRALLLGVTSVCPFAREAISDESVAFGSIDYYGPDQVALGLFENTSFASVAAIEKRTKQITGLKWSQNDSLGVAATNFEQVCHMRHAAVHAQGVLNRGNARALGISRADAARLHVVVDMAHLHLAAKACTSLVKAYNLFIFKGLLQKWLDHKLLVGSWQQDKRYFAPLFELFRSRVDDVAPGSAYHAYRALHPSILRRITAR
ncbi:hypothetical protein ACFWDZ_14540 [Micromonospora aurantiaca]|uniref:hypothetical protein n=1 Tax=Micromonospora aurantiaca (nom. illeg.) TaxID=47850 RepID=UPI0013C2F0F3|nr:hypothetical protein [Micromonospora aurantiaca]